MIDVLIENILAKKNPTVVGLDTRYEYIPEDFFNKFYRKGSGFEGISEAIYEFNKKIIDATSDHIPAVKVQIAYYEMYGVHGLIAFNKTVEYAKSKGLLVIGDVKRNDIGPTAQAYADAFLGYTKTPEGYLQAFNVDFATVNPYFGTDGIKPFIDVSKDNDKGIFVLVKTSNPSSGEIQDIETGLAKVYSLVAKKVAHWSKDLIGKYGYSSVGAVVGATYPEQLREVRAIIPDSFILIPGYGTQGAGIKDIMTGFNTDGLGAIINASRSVVCAWQNVKNVDFSLAALNEVLKMKEEINKELKLFGIRPW